MAPEAHALAAIFEAAANGAFPPADGSVQVVAGRPSRAIAAAVCSFTAHSVVAADVPEAEVLSHLDADDLGASSSVAFLAWLGERTGATPGVLDCVLARFGAKGERRASVPEASPVTLVSSPDLASHPRVARALRLRDGVEAFQDGEERGVVTLGRGLAGRREISVEVEPAHRGAGLGRRLIEAALRLVPADVPVFAQVAPGNAGSLRAFLACGFLPIGSEVIFTRG